MESKKEPRRDGEMRGAFLFDIFNASNRLLNSSRLVDEIKCVPWPDVKTSDTVSLFQTITGVILTKDQEEVVLRILMELPAEAGFTDFITACNNTTAKALGIPIEKIEELNPLLVALLELKGKYPGYFKDEDS